MFTVYIERLSSLRIKSRKRLMLEKPQFFAVSDVINVSWLIDFMYYQLSKGCNNCFLNIIDDFILQCLGIEVRSVTAGRASDRNI